MINIIMRANEILCELKGWMSPEGKYLYHGTSSIYTPSILKHGLIPGSRKNEKLSARIYLAYHSDLAHDEAYRTVHGDDADGIKRGNGVGGVSNVIVIDAEHPSLKGRTFRPDREYGEGLACYTKKAIPAEAIVAVLRGDNAIHKYTTKNKSYSPIRETFEESYQGGFAMRPTAKEINQDLKGKGFAYEGKDDGEWHTWVHPEKGVFRYSPKFGYEHRDGKKMIASGYPALVGKYVSNLV